MKIVYLPGNSIKNKPEGDLITSALTQAGYDVYYHQWNHWSNENQQIGWDAEAEKAKTAIARDDNDLVIIGKSIGTYVALKLITEFKARIKKVILLGIPITSFDKTEELNEYSEILKSLNVPIYVFQNSKDPYSLAESVKAMLQDVKYELIEKDRDDHAYEYPDDIISIIKK